MKYTDSQAGCLQLMPGMRLGSRGVWGRSFSEGAATSCMHSVNDELAGRPGSPTTTTPLSSIRTCSPGKLFYPLRKDLMHAGSVTCSSLSRSGRELTVPQTGTCSASHRHSGWSLPSKGLIRVIRSTLFSHATLPPGGQLCIAQPAHPSVVSEHRTPVQSGFSFHH